jgi:hypothetical protein
MLSERAARDLACASLRSKGAACLVGPKSVGDHEGMRVRPFSSKPQSATAQIRQYLRKPAHKTWNRSEIILDRINDVLRVKQFETS